MNEPIVIPQPILIGFELRKLIAEHNKRVVEIWLHQGSNCKPFTPSTVSAAMADVSRVPASEHGGPRSQAS